MRLWSECSAGGWSHAKPRSREGKRTGSLYGVWCLVFGWASRGRESAGAVPRINAGEMLGFVFKPRMDTNGHELMLLGLSSPRSVLLRLCIWRTLPAVFITRSREGRCSATDVFFATDEHGFSRIIAGGCWVRFEPRMDTNGHELMQLGLSSPRSVQPELRAGSF